MGLINGLLIVYILLMIGAVTPVGAQTAQLSGRIADSRIPTVTVSGTCL